MRLFVAFALTAVVLAGCIGEDEPEVENRPEAPGPASPAPQIPVAPDPNVFLGTIVNDHGTGETGHAGHQIPVLHAEAYNFDLLDFDALSEGLVGPSSGFTEVHVAGDLAVVTSLLGSRGATLVDVSDPRDLQVLSHIYNLDDNWDARISEDARYLFLGCQGSSAFDCTGIEANGDPPGPSGGLVCAPLVTCPGRIAIYDIEDPSSPVFVDAVEMGFTHNVFTYMRDGKHYFMNAGIHIAEWDPENGTVQTGVANIPGQHDMAVQWHPINQTWLLYTGTNSMTIHDVTDPFEPVLVGTLETGPSGWHEQTPMPCLLDGRHITIGAGESPSGLAGQINVIDTTDPSNPLSVGVWQLPDAGDLTAQQSYRFSLHNVDGNCQGQVAVGHYHAGVWVFDISTQERQADPVTMGYYLPHELAPGLAWSPINSAPIGALVSADTPNVWTAQWSADGQTLFVPDMSTGLYALAPTWEFEA